MASTSSYSSFITTLPRTKARSGRKWISAMRNQNSRGRNRNRNRMVDESMIVLRKRIHEIKMMESSDAELPKEWMEWERRVYLSYDAIICDAMAHLQSYFMETRPSLALGMVVLIALSVPTSAAVVLSNLLPGIIHQLPCFLHLFQH